MTFLLILSFSNAILTSHAKNLNKIVYMKHLCTYILHVSTVYNFLKHEDLIYLKLVLLLYIIQMYYQNIYKYMCTYVLRNQTI